MSESDPTGYHDSPDTSDTVSGVEAEPASDATLTTDEDAQREDSVTRPGNEPD